jgi:hypothetical protein
MFDTPMQSPTPGQLLAGPNPPQQVGNTPLATRLAQEPSPQAQPEAQPTPEQTIAAKHHALGKVTSFLFGNERDPNTGEPVPQKPGAVFRSLLAGALLGGAIGSEGHAGGGSVGGFLSGFSRGGNAVAQQTYARQQQGEENAMRHQQVGIEEQRLDEERTVHQAEFEHWNLESIARAREADYRDRDQLQKEQLQDENLAKWAIENNARLASIPGNATPGNGPQLMRDMTNNPTSFNAPPGYGRLLVKHFDFDGLDYGKDGWAEDGKPVDWSKHMRWDLYFVPIDKAKKPVTMSGADWAKYYDVRGLDPKLNYSVESVSHLVAAAASQRKNGRESANQDFKERHDALSATINSARTNITQAESDKRELLRQGYAEADDEVQEITQKIKDEQKRETDAIAEMHPRIRERVKQQPQPQTPLANPAQPSAGPKTGDTQTHAGFIYTFDGSQWVKGKRAQ